jgi:hypothetical protein
LFVSQHDVELNLDPDFHRPHLLNTNALPPLFDTIPELDLAAIRMVVKEDPTPAYDLRLPPLAPIFDLLPTLLFTSGNESSPASIQDVAKYFPTTSPLETATSASPSTSTEGTAEGPSNSSSLTPLECIHCDMTFKRYCDLK